MSLAGYDTARIKRHLLERYCDERCAEFGEPGCWLVNPGCGFCPECIDDANMAIEFMGQAMAIESAAAETPNNTPREQAVSPTSEPADIQETKQ